MNNGNIWSDDLWALRGCFDADNVVMQSIVIVWEKKQIEVWILEWSKGKPMSRGRSIQQVLKMLSRCNFGIEMDKSLQHIETYERSDGTSVLK
jgi:hypothetical protein